MNVNGVINILKPPGMTSHDLVGYVRRLSGQRKTGHSGTLDPGAAGVLPVFMGKATKIIEFMPGDKEYRAEITFGYTTDTQDIQGRLTSEKSAASLSLEQVDALAREFVGELEQVPPMVSAVRHQGKRLYELARQGLEVPRPARRITVFKLTVVSGRGWGTPHPRAIIDLSCSAGTYIRTICHDLGERLGCGALMSFLLRTRVGNFSVNEASTLEELAEESNAGEFGRNLVSLDDALGHLPRVMVKDGAVRAVTHGNRLYEPGVAAVEGNLQEQCYVRLAGPDGLLAVAMHKTNIEDPRKNIFQPVKVLL